MLRRPAWKNLSKALAKSSAKTGVVLDLLKGVASLSYRAVAKSAVDWEGLKP